MIFPFEVTYKKKLKGEIQKYSTADILDFFKNDFEKSGADKIELINDCISVKNDWISFKIRPGLNWNRWIGINSASFQIANIENKDRIAIYKFVLTKLIIISAIMSIVFGLCTQSILLGLFAFFWLGFMNWVVKLFQHLFSFDDFLFEHGFHQTNTLLEVIEHDAKK